MRININLWAIGSERLKCTNRSRLIQAMEKDEMDVKEWYVGRIKCEEVDSSG